MSPLDRLDRAARQIAALAVAAAEMPEELHDVRSELLELVADLADGIGREVAALARLGREGAG